MEGLETLLEKQVQLIQRIETFFELQACKSDIVADLNELNGKCSDSTSAFQGAKQSLDKFRHELGPKYVDVMRKMQRNNLLVIHLMEKLDEIAEQQSHVLRERHPNAQPNYPVASGGNPKSAASADKPMYLAEYQKSPFVAKMKPRCLSFLDFNFRISQEEFDQIPKYMRGRENLDELIAFMQTVIVSCFEEKYTLLYKNKKAVTNQQDLALWKAFNQQQAAFPRKSGVG